MTTKKFGLVAIILFVLLTPTITLAALGVGSDASIVNTDPVPLSFSPPCIPVSGIAGLDTCSAPLTSASTIQDYLIRLYQFAVGISGIVAVGMIVWGSIKISFFTESITQKGEGKDMITSAVIGIVLLLGSYLILRTVNPRIVSLGEALSSDVVPQNTTATSSLGAPPETCASPDTIPGAENTPIGNAKPDDGGNTCKYRKLFLYKDGLRLSKNDGQYYDFVINRDIKPRSVVWTYPYMISGGSTSTARCLVYAYREPGDKGSSFVDLQKTITPCILDSASAQLPGYSGGPGDASSTVTNTIPAETQALAKQLFREMKFVSFDNNGSCNPKQPSSADGVMRYMENGQVPLVCANGCSTNPSFECAQNGVFPNMNILKSIKEAGGTGKCLVVTSLTGGDHRVGSTHYSGRAVDVVVRGGNKDDYNTVMSVMNDSGVTAYCEYRFGGTTKLIPSCGDEAFSTGASNLHIHAEG